MSSQQLKVHSCYFVSWWHFLLIIQNIQQNIHIYCTAVFAVLCKNAESRGFQL